MPMRTLPYILLAALLTACGGGDLDVFNSSSPDAGGGDVAVNEPVDMGQTSSPDAGNDDDMTVVVPSDVPNAGWIGGACNAATDCEYDEAVCLTDGHPSGQCSLGCDRICPDRDGENSVTFCVEKDGEGRCVSQCDFDLYPDAGCRDGYSCRIVSRFGEQGTQRAVCMPGESENPDAVTPCLQTLDELGVIWAAWDYSTQYDDGLACTVDDPIRVTSPINGITYRYYNQDTAGTMSMACPLALALHQLGDVLKQHDLTDVLHIGTFNCRKIAGTTRLSQHGHGSAIDIWGFENAEGDRYILEDHWEHDTTNPTSRKAQVLYDVAQAMHDEMIFNIVLTPNFNAAHDNHFHVDLTEGSNYIGYSVPDFYIGNDAEKWAEHCPSD